MKVELPNMIKDLTNNAETVRYGRWVFGESPRCSICGEEPYIANDKNLPNYCPNCGTKMNMDDKESNGKKEEK